jgi:hypothetical protein
VTDTRKALLRRKLGEFNNFVRFIRWNLLLHDLPRRDGAKFQWDIRTSTNLPEELACVQRFKFMTYLDAD